MMYYSQHFSESEMTRTATNLPNKPTPQIDENLSRLVNRVLEPLRKAMGESVQVTSGYRSPAVNKAVGGASNSFHLRGLAADIHIKDDDYLRRMWLALLANENVDKAIIEHRGKSRWLHVQTSPTPRRFYFELFV